MRRPPILLLVDGAEDAQIEGELKIFQNREACQGLLRKRLQILRLFMGYVSRIYPAVVQSECRVRVLMAGDALCGARLPTWQLNETPEGMKR